MTETQKIALVTGASRGLGAALAEDLAGRGYHVLAVARTVGALEELDDRIRQAGGSATLAPMDVAEAPAMQQLAEAVLGRWGGLDLWAHAAIHAAPLAPAPHVDGKDWARSVLVNMDVTRGLIALLERLRAGEYTFAGETPEPADDPAGPAEAASARAAGTTKAKSPTAEKADATAAKARGTGSPRAAAKPSAAR